MLKTYFSKFTVYLLLGNHDLYYENSLDISILEMFEDLPNIKIIMNSPESFNIMGKEWLMCPWILKEKHDEMLQYFNTLSKKGKDRVIVGHFDTVDIQMEPGNISQSGFSADTYMAAARLVISGHYHGPSLLEKDNSRLLYVGTPYPLTFINSNQRHGYWVVSEDLTTEFVPNMLSPMFYTIYDTDNIDNLDFENSFVRAYVSDTMDNADYLNFRTLLESKKPILKKVIRYRGAKATVESASPVSGNGEKLVGMDTVSISAVYINHFKDTLPKLKTHADPSMVIMDRVHKINSTIR
jgi:DNA repair exonuclease SbcCD nuclease subunit